MKLVYEVICTYTVEAESKAAAGRVASGVAQGLARTGITKSSGPDGNATLMKTTARFKRIPGAVAHSGGRQASQSP